MPSNQPQARPAGLCHCSPAFSPACAHSRSNPLLGISGSVAVSGNGEWIDALPEDRAMLITEWMIGRLCSKASPVPTSAPLRSPSSTGRMDGIRGEACGENHRAQSVTRENRERYAIYPGKARVKGKARGCQTCLRFRIEVLGRCIRVDRRNTALSTCIEVLVVRRSLRRSGLIRRMRDQAGQPPLAVKRRAFGDG